MSKRKQKPAGNRVAATFFKHKLGVAGLVILGLLYFAAFFAEFLSPYDFAATRDGYANAAPTAVHWFHEGKFIGPFVYGMERARDPETFQVVYKENSATPYPLRFLVKGDPYLLWGFIKADIHLIGIEEQQKAVWFALGGDQFGRDLLSRIMAGSRVSLSAGVVGTPRRAM